MPSSHSRPPRSTIPAAERQARSRLVKLLSSGHGLIRGTLSVRERTCGKQNCKCARGEKHSSLYIVVSVDGKYKQTSVPKSLEADVRQWVAEYQRAQELIEELSKTFWNKIQNRED